MKSVVACVGPLSLVLLLSATSPAAQAPVKPNIVFILGDDYGIDGVGCYGSDRFKDLTPNLDALAKSGTRFERCYSTPLCGPSRCVIMTGRYGFRTGGLTNQTSGNASFKNEPSLAKVLKQAGYVTGMAGKWRQMSDSPGDWGFDEYITDPTAGGYYWEKSYTKNGQLVETPQEIYFPDVQQAFAVDFITRHRDKPFYFYYSMHLVHGPILRTPDSAPGAEPGRPNNAQERPPLYNDNVAYLDKQVGQLVAELDRLGLRERTLIVFSTDNGTPGVSSTIGGRHINGGKGTMLEGGSRVPLIASWKGAMPQGRVVSDLIDFSDILPTFAEIAGGKLPEQVTLDGRSFAPQLRGETGNPRSSVFVQLGANWYARNDGWKLTQSGELFDMREAPFVEQPVPADTTDAKAVAARKSLQVVLDQLDPKGGKIAPPAGDPKTKAARRAKRKAKNG